MRGGELTLARAHATIHPHTAMYPAHQHEHTSIRTCEPLKRTRPSKVRIDMRLHGHTWLRTRARAHARYHTHTHTLQCTGTPAPARAGTRRSRARAGKVRSAHAP